LVQVNGSQRSFQPSMKRRMASSRAWSPRVRHTVPEQATHMLLIAPQRKPIDLVNSAAPFSDCGRMTVGELIEVLSEYAESEDYDPASPVYLLSGNETPRPLMEIEPIEDDDSLILVAV